MLPPKTVSRMDAWFEPPWMGLRRVFGGNTQFMSRCQCICLKALFTTDMNRKHLAETRRKPIHGGSAATSLWLTVSARCFRSMSLDIICGTKVHYDGAFYKSGPAADSRVKIFNDAIPAARPKRFLTAQPGRYCIHHHHHPLLVNFRHL